MQQQLRQGTESVVCYPHSLGFSISSPRPGQPHIHSLRSVAQAQEAGGRKKGLEAQSHFSAGSFSRKHTWSKSSMPKPEIPRLSVVFNDLCSEGLMSATGSTAAAPYQASKLKPLQFKAPTL